MQTQEELIESCMSLVRFIAGQYSSQNSLIPFEDLVSEGYVGLVQAAAKYEPSRGVKFSTYAATRIRGSILDALRRENLLSRDVSRWVDQVSTTMQEMTDELGREPSDGEVAGRLNVTPRKLNEVRRMQALRVVSLDKRMGDYHEEYEGHDDSPEDFVVGKMLATELRGHVARLMPRDREVIQRIYWGREKHSSIASDLGISESRVSQIQKRAIQHIRRMMNEDRQAA